MNQVEFDQEILKMREEKKEKLNPLYEKSKELDSQITDTHIRIQRLTLQKMEMCRERKGIHNQISDIERSYRERQWQMNRELNEHKLSEEKEAE